MSGTRARRRGRGRRRAPNRRRQMPLWQELPLLLVVAFCLAVLIRTFLVQAFFIPSGSMEHTLEVEDRVLVNKVVYDMRNPLHGEIVVFRGPDNWRSEQPPAPPASFSAKLSSTIGDLVGVSRPGEKDFIKRVVGLPGDRVSCCDPQGRILVNGQPIDEPYVEDNSPLDLPPAGNECRSRRFNEIVVGPGQMFVMGDHRLVSQDSRCQGQVPIENVIGRAFVIVWPKKSWAQLPVPSSWDRVPSTARPSEVLNPELGPVPRRDVPDTGGGVAVVLPILLSWGLSARSGPPWWSRRRRLRP